MYIYIYIYIGNISLSDSLKSYIFIDELIKNNHYNIRMYI
jgi:hypothetical protein